MFVLGIDLFLGSVIVLFISIFSVLFNLEILRGFKKRVVVNGTHVFAEHFHVFGFLDERFIWLLNLDGLRNTKNSSNCSKLHVLFRFVLNYIIRLINLFK